MSTKIGHFEILSELAKSSTGAVYKANDPQSGQTVALKVIELSAFRESAPALEQSLLQEAETTKTLSSSNLAPVFGAGEIEGKFCAAMEYIQGNSIATMLARKEGFSIWDLLDIGRQVCAGLDHAHSKNVFHYSLEPAKIMCGWDGTVKILGFGVSSVGKFTKQIPGPVPSILPYMSPEQVRDEAIDGRSNVFTLGAMFYEMVTDRKAFERDGPDSLRQSILESTPVPPMHVNAKVHPLLSDLIMKALDKDPAKRYQSGRELLDDLEKCKESKPQAAKKPAETPKGLVTPDKAKSAVQAKSVAATPAQPSASRPASPAAGRPSTPKSPATQPAEKKFVVPTAPKSDPASQPAQPASSRVANKPGATAAPKAAAAAAGWGGSASASSAAPEIDSSNQFITSCVKATIKSAESHSPNMSSAVVDEPEIETFAPDAPKIAVDPMMAEAGPSRGHSTSFSEIAELPPLKEVYIAPEPPPTPLSSSIHAAEPSATMYQGVHEAEEKPRVQPREVAQKALKEIKGVPPRLMLYSIAGAVVLILIIVAVLYFKYSGTGDDDAGTARSAAAAQPAARQPAPESRQPAPAVEATPSEPAAEPQPEPAQPAAASKIRNARKKPAPAPVVVPGQMAVESTPPGALVQVDGKSDPSWVTPFAMSGMKPGQHSITVSKAGYSTDTRAVEISSGSKANVILHLAQLTAFLAVKSDPTGANIYVDGKDMGKTTPAQVNVDKGSHVILIRKMGYIDETTQAQFVLGQTVNYSPSLRPLGNVDNIKTVGKMKKLFGGNGGQPGQATISIRTQPKGAQISINQHMVEKGTPVEILLDPGNYVLDITLSGYAPVHKVITADKGGKLVVDETLQPQ
jgi:serine/threonine protein kinase